MDNFRPETSFSHDVAQRYDDDLRGDEEVLRTSLLGMPEAGPHWSSPLAPDASPYPLQTVASRSTASNCHPTWLLGCERSPAARR